MELFGYTRAENPQHLVEFNPIGAFKFEADGSWYLLHNVKFLYVLLSVMNRSYAELVPGRE